MQKKFSYPLVVAELPLAEQHYQLEAKTEDCAYLAEILQVPAVRFLKADIFLKNNHSQSMLEVSGHITAGLKLESVISLEVFEQNYDFDFEVCYDTQATYDSQKEEDAWDKELPEVILDGKLDLADVVIEQVALKIDDYPRQEGEVFAFQSEFGETPEEHHNPFDVLAKLKK